MPLEIGLIRRIASTSFMCEVCTDASEIGRHSINRCSSEFPGLQCMLADWSSHLRPGGWYEQVEYSVHWRCDDGSIPEGHIFQRWSEIFVQAGEKMGKTFRILDLQRDYLVDAGFTHVIEKKFKMPLGPWAKDAKLKEVGRWHLLECYQGIEGWAIALLTRVMGVSKRCRC